MNFDYSAVLRAAAAHPLFDSRFPSNFYQKKSIASPTPPTTNLSSLARPSAIASSAPDF
jgi:hypothetical protein